MKPLISIIVPVYNIKKYIKNCLDSLLSQTYQNLEILLIDDGSTDGSGELCDELQKNDSHIKVFHTKNSGLSAARNFGLKNATGDFAVFVDGDDMVEKEYVEYLYNLLTKYSADMSICSFKTKTETDEKSFAKNAREALFDTETCLEKMLLEDGFNVSACGKLFPKKLFKYLNFPVGKLHEDVGTTYLPILHSQKIAFGPEPNYIYFQRGSSITHNFSTKKLDLIDLTNKMCDEIDQKFPNLKDATNLRRMHARFSILRQLPASEKELATEISNYLKSHKDFVLKNQKAGKRDKLAMYSLLLGQNFFHFSWKVYESLFK